MKRLPPVRDLPITYASTTRLDFIRRGALSLIQISRPEHRCTRLKPGAR
jgi:hypothetical protein